MITWAATEKLLIALLVPFKRKAVLENISKALKCVEIPADLDREPRTPRIDNAHALAVSLSRRRVAR